MFDHPHCRTPHSHALRWLLPLLILALVPLSAAAQGATIWQVRIGRPVDGARAVAADSAGNVYLVGTSNGDFGGQTAIGIGDAFVRKYSSSGTQLWTRLIGVVGDETSGLGVAVDADDNLYVVGRVNANLDGQVNAGLGDAFVRKFSSEGTSLWTRLIGTPTPDYAGDVAVDGAGRVYVTGGTYGSFQGQPAAGDNIFVSVYDSSGAHQWTRQTGSAGYDSVYSVAVDGVGNAYLAGFVDAPINGQPIAGVRDGVLIKYHHDGTHAWTRLTGYTGYDAAQGVAVSAAGTSYLVGHRETDALTTDVFVRAYDASGALQWSREFGSPEMDWSADVGLDAAGDLYVAGDTRGRLDGQPSPRGESDMFVRKYSPSGSARWTLMLGTPDSDVAEAIAVTPTGVLYLAGFIYGGFQSDALLVRSINPTLTPRTFLPLIPQ